MRFPSPRPAIASFVLALVLIGPIATSPDPGYTPPPVAVNGDQAITLLVVSPDEPGGLGQPDFTVAEDMESRLGYNAQRVATSYPPGCSTQPADPAKPYTPTPDAVGNVSLLQQGFTNTPAGYISPRDVRVGPRLGWELNLAGLVYHTSTKAHSVKVVRDGLHWHLCLPKPSASTDVDRPSWVYGGTAGSYNWYNAGWSNGAAVYVHPAPGHSAGEYYRQV